MADDLADVTALLQRAVPVGGVPIPPSSTLDGERGGAWTVVNVGAYPDPTRPRVLVLTHDDVRALLALPRVRGVYVVASPKRLMLSADIENGATPDVHRRPLHPPLPRLVGVSNALPTLGPHEFAVRPRKPSDFATTREECSSPAQCDMLFYICDMVYQRGEVLIGASALLEKPSVEVRRVNEKSTAFYAVLFADAVCVQHGLFDLLRGVAPDSVQSVTVGVDVHAGRVRVRLTVVLGDVPTTWLGKRARDDDDDDARPLKRARV